MKTDKELLELAAKAAGLVGHDGLYAVPDDSSGEWRDWNPLTDDGDALRLAVKLKLDVTFDHEDECCSVWSYGNPDVNVKFGYDPLAATRRAIVMAAAVIGSKK